MRGWSQNFILILATVSLWHVIVGSLVGLGDAEALYVAYALFPSASYLDHPPMIGWLLYIATSLAGFELWAIRSVATLCHLLTFIGVYRLAGNVYGPGEADDRAALVFALVPMFAIGGLAAVPDAPAAALWVWTLVLFLELLRRARQRGEAPSSFSLILLGGLLGATFLSKYTGALLIPVVLAVLSHRQHRFLFRRPRIWLAAAACLVVVSPVIWWNIQHDWASLLHRLVWSQQGFGPSLATFGQTIGGQLGYGGLFVILFVIVLRELWRTREDPEAFALFCAGALPLAFTILLCLLSPAAEPHWTAQGYIALVVAAGGLLPKLSERSRRIAPLFKASIGLAISAIVIIHLVVFTPILQRLSGASYEPRYDLSVELRGWPDVAERVLDLRGDAEPVVSSHYTICSQLLRSMVQRDPSARRAIRCVTAETDDYDLWGMGAVDTEPSLLYVEDDRFGQPPSEVLPGFDLHVIGEYRIRRGEKTLRTFTFHRATQRRRAAIP